MTLEPLTSSFIKAAGYEPEKKTLRVQFHTGEMWEYRDVEPELYTQLREAPSAGKFFHAKIKGLRAKLIGRSVGAPILAHLGREIATVPAVERPDGTTGPPVDFEDPLGRHWTLIGYEDKTAYYEPKT